MSVDCHAWLLDARTPDGNNAAWRTLARLTSDPEADSRDVMAMRFWHYALAALVTMGIESWAAAAERPNIVFILADDLGYTDLACYGSRYYETPHINRLARDGMRFTAGYTCGPNCQPTRAALMSGQYGPRTGVYTVGSIDRFDWQSRPLRPLDNVEQLPVETVTIAEALRAAGYKTGMFGKWHLGEDDDHHPLAQGFDEAISSQGQHFNFKTKPATRYADGTYLADFITDRAVDFIRRHREVPFFLYVPHFAVHGPHEAKADLVAHFDGKPAAGGHHDKVYAAMIASVDASVGRIVEVLDELKLSENTLVIFSSDNGGVGGYERLGIHGGSVTDNAPLRGGKGMLYEGGIRVPYVFRMPGTIAAGAETGEPIVSVDLYPTLLEVSKAPPPKQPLDGTSYWPQLAGKKTLLERNALYWHFPGYLGAGQGTWRTTPAGAIRTGDWKLIEFFEDWRTELYNLRDDIGETRNLAPQMPERTVALREQLAAWRTRVGAKMPTRNEAPTTPMRRKNRAPRVDN